MFTSRAEYRILLRQDNADLRLTEIGYKLGLASEERYQKMMQKKTKVAELTSELSKLKISPEPANQALAEIGTSELVEKTTALNLLKRPQVGIAEIARLGTDAAALLSNYSEEVMEQAEIALKYESYIDREQRMAEKIGSLEDYKIKSDFDYDKVKALSAEAREKLKRIRPETIGQMSRISGVSPADVSVLTVYLGK